MKNRYYIITLTMIASLLPIATARSAPLPAEVTLDDVLPENGGDGSAAFVVRGNADSTRLDLVAAAGDVNGDGTRDFMVGTSNDLAAGDSRGVTYVIFGGAGVFEAEFEETGLLAANGGDGSAGFVIYGAASDDNLAPLDALDLNGDGYDDLLLGSRGDIAATGASDELYVVYGREQFAAEFDLASLAPANGGNGSNGIIIKGGGRTGFRAGDINSDSRDDLAVYNRDADLNGFDSGAVWVLYGRPFGLGPIVDLAGIDPANGGTGFAGFQIVGEPGDRLNTSAGAGNFNGDSFDDLVIGNPNRDLPGAADIGSGYVFFGSGSIPAETVITDLEVANGGDGSAGLAVFGETAAARFSGSVAGAGDINNDGFDDVMLSGVDGFADSPPYYARLIVLFGSDSGLPTETSVTDIVSGAAGIGAELPPAGTDAGVYAVMQPAGDTNNDGFDDILITLGDTFSSFVGATYLVYGQADFPDGLILADLSVINGGDGSRGVRFRPDDVFGANFGLDSRGLGDVNGDQIDDFVIPDIFSNTNNFRGRQYIFLGPTSDADSDGDGVNDTNDNCSQAANAVQTDSDLDGYGNACDPDLNNDCTVNFLDLNLFGDVFFTNFEPADFDVNGIVNFLDLSVMGTLFFGPPGPSGTVDTCTD